MGINNGIYFDLRLLFYVRKSNRQAYIFQCKLTEDNLIEAGEHIVDVGKLISANPSVNCLLYGISDLEVRLI